MYSDEESSDTAALLYLPISPEIDDPEEGWGPGAEIVSITIIDNVFLLLEGTKYFF